MSKETITITKQEYEDLLKYKKAYDTFSRARQNYREKNREKYNEYHREYYKKRREDLKKQIDNTNNDGIIKGE